MGFRHYNIRFRLRWPWNHLMWQLEAQWLQLLQFVYYPINLRFSWIAFPTGSLLLAPSLLLKLPWIQCSILMGRFWSTEVRTLHHILLRWYSHKMVSFRNIKIIFTSSFLFSRQAHEWEPHTNIWIYIQLLAISCMWRDIWHHSYFQRGWRHNDHLYRKY